MSSKSKVSPRERLVRHVHTLESLVAAKQEAAAELLEALEDAKRDGFDPATLRVVLKLRQMTPEQRRERRALEAIYMAALGMLEGDALPEAARRRLDGSEEPAPSQSSTPQQSAPSKSAPSAAQKPAKQEQPELALKDPEEARSEGGEAAVAGKRIYDNPFRAGDPCRAAWDEGWCAQRKSHGMEPPAAYQRRTEKPAEKADKAAEKADKAADDKKGPA